MGRREMPKEEVKTKRKSKKKKLNWLRIILVTLLIVLIIWVICFIYQTNKNGGGMQGMLATIVGHSADTLKDLEPLYVLVLGESVSGDSRLTDTIIVCKYDPKEQTAAMLSIPRDTFTGTDRSKATAYYKINNAYRGGTDPENALKEVNNITGLDIEYYVWVNTNVLKELVDEIGGVYFDVPINMYYTFDTEQDLYIDLKQGYQLLDGDKAEQVVRFRHNNDGSTYPAEYGLEDYGRMRTQRAFITATIQQTLKPENIFKIGNFIDIAYRNIKTNLSVDIVKDYIPYAVNFSTENLKSDRLPGKDDYVKSTGAWMFFHDKEKTEEMIQQLFFNVELEDEENVNNTSTNQTVNNTINVVNTH